MSAIQWTDETWNPLVGCSKQSAGCKNCCAIGAAASVLRRLDGTAKSERGLATVEAYRDALDLSGRQPRWSGHAVPMLHQLAKPLGWKKPRRVFVNSMSDLFHPTVGDDYIAAVFGVMAACPQHTFQVLTKHPERAAEWFRWVDSEARDSMRRDRHRGDAGSLVWCRDAVLKRAAERHGLRRDALDHMQPWPLPNVWLGCSVENQATADEHIPHLLQCPAAVRWVSYEPALGPVDFERRTCSGSRHHMINPEHTHCAECGSVGVDGVWLDDLNGGLNWIVVGGESGPGARPFDVQWARDTIRQCREAGVPVFVKQLGADPVDGFNGCGVSKRAGVFDRNRQCGLPECEDYGCQHGMRLRDRKGGAMSEWPADLRVREFPEVPRG